MYHLLLTLLLTIASTCHAAEAQINLNGATLDVDLAITQNERSHGLMWKKELKKNQGMLFVYDEPQLLSFWMKETLIPLDILFFDREGRLLEFFADTPPCKNEPCKTYSNRLPAQYVLELPAGTAKRLELKRGDRFQSGSLKK